jgi:hypothetical protein
MAIQEGRLLGIPKKYHFDFLELLQNFDFVSEDDATQQMVIATHILHHMAERSPFCAIETFINVTKRTVQQHWKCSFRGLFPHGRQRIFPEAIRFDRAEEVILRERVEVETKDEIASDEDLHDLGMDLE